MYRYIFGFDKSNPVKCARELKRRGISAVITDASSAPLAPILADEGLDTFLCFGAHSLGKDAARYRRCIDAYGIEWVWFSSGCPNDAALCEDRLQAVLSKADPGIKGIFVDGARFASFASAEGLEAFFTCFCPECMERMSAMGMDAEAVKVAVRSLKHGLPGDMRRVRDWLSFRSACVKRYMDAFSRRVHALSPNLKSGTFIFEPFLSPFVGQTMASCASLDIIAPMLYRNYPHSDGPACMGHEWAALYHMFGDNTPDLISLTGLSGHALPQPGQYPAAAETLLQKGFAPSQVGLCVKTAKSLMHTGQMLWPILLIEDERLAETDRVAFESGADAVGYFAYGQAEIPCMNTQEVDHENHRSHRR